MQLSDSQNQTLEREHGAAALEFVLLLPLACLMLALLVSLIGAFSTALINQRHAGLAARMAATDHDSAVFQAIGELSPSTTLEIDPPSGIRGRGDLVTATTTVLLRLPTGQQIPLTATATYLTEDL